MIVSLMEKQETYYLRHLFKIHPSQIQKKKKNTCLLGKPIFEFTQKISNFFFLLIQLKNVCSLMILFLSLCLNSDTLDKLRTKGRKSWFMV